MDFNEIIRTARLSPSEVARITNRTPTTVRRWYRTNKAPESVTELLKALCGFSIPSTDPAWSGWSILNGRLRDPDGNEYTPAEIRSIWAYRQIAQEYRRRNAAPAQYLLDL
jgi:hypothetical protein